MKKILLFSICAWLVGCGGLPRPDQYTANGKQFKGKYSDFLESDEQEISSWYHYVKSKRSDGKYVLRIFFPETRQLISEVIYTDQGLKSMTGPAAYWYENGFQSSQGIHVMGNREGHWTRFHRSTGKIAEQGEYTADKRNGTWNKFDKKGRLLETLIYKDGNQEGDFTQYDSLKNIINTGVYRADSLLSQTKEVSQITPDLMVDVEEMPYLSQCKHLEDVEARNKCSSEALLTHIYRNLKYPHRPRVYGLEGMTVTQFVVEKDGSITNVDVVIGLCQDFKNECHRVISNLPKWEPGRQNGKAVRVLFTLPTRFKLE